VQTVTARADPAAVQAALRDYRRAFTSAARGRSATALDLAGALGDTARARGRRQRPALPIQDPHSTGERLAVPPPRKTAVNVAARMPCAAAPAPATPPSWSQP
jgi:hypothetical protein